MAPEGLPVTPTTTDALALLAAIQANPDDDMPRLAYAERDCEVFASILLSSHLRGEL